jgi:hypothetical protein
MAQKKFVVGCFDDEAVLFPAVKQVRTAGYKIKDVFLKNFVKKDHENFEKID